MLELSIVSITVLLAEILGSIAGGGGFIIQPILMLLRLTSNQAVALCVLASAGTVMGGLLAFNSQRKLDCDPAPQRVPGVM